MSYSCDFQFIGLDVSHVLFASIADTLREEFANKGLRLYENIYN